MSTSHYKYLFGPVPSRRFGRSLGIDLTPFKTCSFDCIFCQLGPTTNTSCQRREYVPVDQVIDEVQDWLETDGAADYITLAGSGEPTLNSGFGRLIDFVRSATTIPVALLTNGSLLSDPQVRAQCARANVVKVSLSAWDQSSMETINRPHPQIRFDQLVEGQRLLRKEFSGQLWMELFLMDNVNAETTQVARIATLARSIAPDIVQLNTVVRPPCEDYATAVSEDRMLALAELFQPAAEVIAEFTGTASGRTQANEADILEMVQRRPCTLEEICQVFSMHRNEASKYLGKLTRRGQAVQIRNAGALYFSGLRNKPTSAQTNKDTPE